MKIKDFNPNEMEYPQQQLPKEGIGKEERRILLVNDIIKSAIEKYIGTSKVDIPAQEFEIKKIAIKGINSTHEREKIWFFEAKAEIAKSDISGVTTIGKGSIIGEALIEWRENTVNLKECPQLPECEKITITKMNIKL